LKEFKLLFIITRRKDRFRRIDKSF